MNRLDPPCSTTHFGITWLPGDRWRRPGVCSKKLCTRTSSDTHRLARTRIDQERCRTSWYGIRAGCGPANGASPSLKLISCRKRNPRCGLAELCFWNRHSPCLNGVQITLHEMHQVPRHGNGRPSPKHLLPDSIPALTTFHPLPRPGLRDIHRTSNHTVLISRRMACGAWTSLGKYYRP